MSSSYDSILLENRRYRILVLCSSIATIFSLFIILILIFKSNESVRFVEFSKKGDFGVRVLKPNQMSAEAQELIILSQLKKYIVSRHEMLGGRKYNKNEYDSKKYDYVKAFSAPEVFAQYDAEFRRLHEEARFYERDVNILSAVAQEKNKYLFTFELITYYEDEAEPVITKYSVYMTFKFVDLEKIPSRLRDDNPLGIQINWYRGDGEAKNNLLDSEYEKL